ncbi:hypothetical protein H4W79_003738 [Nocardiopsis terrae]|uniref:Uncharacterized protein n=1 Tax=Nocardiopsis terrae TaxID=372655 RepID=A0ABR9HKH7_9ACTN|nr:hypothetical protein [Nocardiopsis terrae]
MLLHTVTAVVAALVLAGLGAVALRLVGMIWEGLVGL